MPKNITSKDPRKKVIVRALRRKAGLPPENGRVTMVKSFADGSYEGRVLEWVPSVFIHTDKGGHYAKKGHHKVLGFFMVPQSQFHWIVEVIADDSGQWCGNDLRFDTKEEAEEYGNDLWRRWLSCKTYRTRFVDKEEQR